MTTSAPPTETNLGPAELRALADALEYHERLLDRYSVVQTLLQDATQRPTDLKAVLSRIVDLSLEEGQLAETGTVFLVTRQAPPRTAEFYVKRMWTAEHQVFDSPEPLEFHRFVQGSGLLGAVLEDSKTLVTNDAPADSRYVRFSREPQLRNVICAPVKYGDTLLAVLSLHTRDRHDMTYNVEDVAFVETLAAIAAISIRANHNGLTLLPNRDLMFSLIQDELSRSATVVTAYLDLDNFGKLNDNVGHGNADEALRQFGEFLKAESPPGCIICHPHGDEFVMVFPDASKKDARKAVQGILDRLKERTFQIPSRRGPQPTQLSFSAGVAEGDATVSPQELVQRADKVHRKGKERGRGLVV